MITAPTFSASYLRTLPPETVRAKLDTLTDQEAQWLKYYWQFWARPEQLAPPGFSWRVWLILAGRGWGKTQTGAEWVIAKAEANPGCIIHLIGRTAADVRDVMITGPAGILANSPPWFRPAYHPSLRMLVWPNGSIAKTFSADEPDSLRGPQCHFLWGDEWASWRYSASWDEGANLGLRLGAHPQACLTTTPKGGDRIRKLLARPTTYRQTGNMHTKANAANLAGAFLDDILAEYANTRIGRQELAAELLEDAEGALWKRETMIDRWRVTEAPKELDRVVVGVDPPASATGAECGILAAGRAPGRNGRPQAYLLEDASLKGTPAVWGTEAVNCYFRNGANLLVGETNNGGDMVEHAIKTVPGNDWRPGGEAVHFEKVHAARSKQSRADLIVPFYEQGRVHHVGYFSAFEDQQCQWEPDAGMPSPDRLDAGVWALWALLIGRSKSKEVVTF